MRIHTTLAALLLTTGLANAQAVSPLGGSTNNAGSPPPVVDTQPAPVTPATPATPVTPVAPGTSSAVPSTTTAPTSGHTGRRHGHRKSMTERFAAANTTHDGKLTLEQARAGHMRAVVRDFAEIDKSKHGYVTLDEIRSYRAERRAARKAAKSN